MRTPLARIRTGGLVLAVAFLAAVIGYRWLAGYDWMTALYMVVITISTVGYGEQSELTPHVQAFTIGVILVGISAAAYTFGGLIQLMLEGELEKLLGKRRMSKEILHLSGHTVICGFGRMGNNLAEELRRHGKSVVIIDRDDDKITDANAAGFLTVSGDASEESSLIEAGLLRATALVSTFPNDAESVFLTLTAKTVNPSITIIARAERESTQAKLEQAGATHIVMPTVVGAKQMGRMLTRPSTARLINLVDEGGSGEYDLDELEIGAGSPLVGMTVQQTRAHHNHQLLVVAIKTPEGQMVFNPVATQTFHEGEVVVLTGRRDEIRAFRQEFGS